ncbi:MAG: branched-chain amino acid ABC transporter permease [Pseudomonadota bacterium]
MQRHLAPACALAFLALAWAITQGVANEYVFFAGFVILQYVVLATAWNVLGGYCGYVNFGSAAFFAAGAYASIFLIKSTAAPVGLQVLGGLVVGALLGLGVGYVALRLRGIYFAIATIALAVVLETVIQHWDYVGAARGYTALRPAGAPGFSSYNRFLFFAMAVLALAAVMAARFIQTSWIGRGLHAILDNEDAAECSGVPTLRLKLLAAAVSGALMAMAGTLQPYYANFVEPTAVFNLNYAILALAMPVVGGTRHWMGPVLGALLLGGMQQVVTVTVSSELNVLIVGVLLMVFVIAAPKGILGGLEALARRRRGAPAAAVSGAGHA